jgi:hypothetical protein
MRFRLTRLCGKYILVLRDASGNPITGEKIFLRLALEAPESVRGYAHNPEFDLHLKEVRPGHYVRLAEGGLYDIYRNGEKWSDFSPTLIIPCDAQTSIINPIVPPDVVSLNCVTDVSALDPMFSWSPAAGAIVYDLQVATDINFTNLIVDVHGTTETSYTYSGILTPGLFYWRVRSENSLGVFSDWSNVCVVDILPIFETPTINCLTPIADGSDVNFTWDAVVGATHYEFELATDVDFVNIIVDDNAVLTTAYDAGSLPTGTYYWRVRALGADPLETSAWSDTCSVIIHNLIDTPMTVCEPTIDQTDPVFEWTPVAGATSYEFQLATDSGFTALIVTATGLTMALYTYSGSLEPGTYYWRVRAVRDDGSGILDISDYSTSCVTAITPFFDVLSKTSCSVTVEWGNLALSTVNVRIERQGSLNSDTGAVVIFRTVDTVAVGSSPLQDIELLPGFQYTYRLFAITAGLTETNPVADVVTITNPEGSFAPTYETGGHGTSIGSGVYNQYTMPAQSFYDVLPTSNRGFDYERFTVEFYLKRVGDGSTGDIWGREVAETIFGGSTYGEASIRLVGDQFHVYLTRYFTDVSNQCFVSVNPGVTVGLNETHHWAFVFDVGKLPNGSNPSHQLWVYKDGIIQNPNVAYGGATYGTNTPLVDTTHFSPNYIFIQPTFYQNESTFIFMKDVEAEIDEFRVWGYAKTAADVAAGYPYIIRSNPKLLYRFGFDNFDLQTASYPPEFDLYGAIGIDPAHDGIYSADSRVQFQFDSAADNTAINKHIREPLLVTVSALPVTPTLLEPTDGSVIDVGSLQFFWVGISAEHFEFEIATDVGFTSIVYTDTNVPTQSYIPTGLSLNPNTTYYWRVRGVAGANFSAWSTPFSFINNVVITATYNNPTKLLTTEPYDVDQSSNFNNPTFTIVNVP